MAWQTWDQTTDEAVAAEARALTYRVNSNYRERLMSEPNSRSDRLVRVRVVDAFTDRPLSGNPAGVILLEGKEWPDSTLMRRIASELGHETAFARPLPNGSDADWALRWFTPGSESNVCGHATLATLHVLRSDCGGPLSVRFDTAYGFLDARAETEGPITLDFPSTVLADADVPHRLSAALGVEIDHATATGVLGDLLVTAHNEAAVRTLRPDLNALADVIEQHGLRGIIVTARADESGGRYDFVSRFFAPATGVPEDPVTGSAHTALAPFWAPRLGRERLVGLQVSDRSGLVDVVLHGDRVEIAGNAVTVIDGTLTFG